MYFLYNSAHVLWRHQPNMVVIFAKDDWRGFSTWLAMFEQKLDHPQLINLFYLGIFHKRTEASTKDLEKMLLAFLKVHRDVFLSCERMTLLYYTYFLFLHIILITITHSVKIFKKVRVWGNSKFVRILLLSRTFHQYKYIHDLNIWIYTYVLLRP